MGEPGTQNAPVRLFLIRHGAVVPPSPGVYYGGTEVPLSPRGEAEARAAARLLAGVELEAVYCSPLSRARFGADCLIRSRPGLEVEVLPQLREIDRGRWTGNTPEQVDQLWPGQRAAHDRDPEAWRGHGGESLGDLRDRVLAAFGQLVAAHPTATIAVVSHLFPTRAILAQALAWPLERWTDLRLPTGSVSLLERQDEGWAVPWHGRQGEIEGADPAADRS